MKAKHIKQDDNDEPRHITDNAQTLEYFKADSISQNLKNISIVMEQIIQNNEVLTTKQQELKMIYCEINTEMTDIARKTQTIEDELAEAKAALHRALKAVSNIQLKHLNEIKALKRPPQVIVPVFEAVAAIIYDFERQTIPRKRKTDTENAIKLVHGYTRGLPLELTELIHKFDFIPMKIIKIVRSKVNWKGMGVVHWKDILRMISHNKFMRTLLEFDAKNIREKTRKKILGQYLCEHHFSFKRVHKASRAAAPLTLWVKAQLKYSYLLDYVEPMQMEVEELKHKLSEKQKYSERLYEVIEKLKISNTEYRKECEGTIENIEKENMNAYDGEIKLMMHKAYQLMKATHTNMDKLLLIGFIRQCDEKMNGSMNQETQQIIHTYFGSLEYIIADKINTLMITHQENIWPEFHEK